MTRAVSLAFLLAASLLAACSDDGSGSTGAECPPTNPPTYESFGKNFFDTYCVNCHDSAKSGASRGGAPAGLNYNTLAGVMKDLSIIDAEAAAGPNGTNTSMPLGTPSPTVAERTTLGEFLACEQAK
jgi:mono/diheme cytochrome c family protein